MLFGEGHDLRPHHHRAVVIGQFADHADRRQAGEFAQIDGGLGMAGAHQHAALARHQRKHMAGTHEIAGAEIVVGEAAHGVGALFGRNAGGQAVLDVHRDGEGGAERRVVVGHHRREMQAPRLGDAERRADDAAAIADDEGHFLRRAQARGHHQIAFVLAVVVIGHDDDLAALHRFDGLGHRIRHGVSSTSCPRPQTSGRKSFGVTAPLVSRAMACAVSRDIQTLS